MKTKAAVLFKNKDLFQIKEIEVDELRSDEILVRIVGVGVCHTDEVIRQNEGLSPFPIILGHEGSGVVEQVGSGVDDFKIGDYVVLSFSFCSKCDTCISGHPNVCETFGDVNFLGKIPRQVSPYQHNGEKLNVFFGQSSFSQYCVVRANDAVKVNVDNEKELSLMGPLGCGIQTGCGTVLNALKPAVGDDILIAGAGGVGIAAVMGAKLAGCRNIIIIDILDHRLELAKSLGATHIINGKRQNLVEEVLKITNGKGVHFALDATGVTPLIVQQLHCIRTLGTMCIIGYARKIEIDLFQDIVLKCIRIVPVSEGNSIPKIFIPKLVELYKQGKLPFDKLVEFYDFNDINQAFNDSASGKVIKPILLMPK
ncbi:hypothetical protein CYY_002321 [Polysphondylium violaceum]|uniref:Enoyl reductase (ER) domain-containing protein n=1 Tax=Polysphondylium violaceum TaxID=133409 RepID=A0A8J4V9Q7_9MYCE|nr:hypothetical protein CYY_002321 [Polysphondylium violaceum]